MSFGIFHDANHHKSNQNDQKTSNLEPFEYQFHLMVIFLISGGHFVISRHNENTDIEHKLICLWHDQRLAVTILETSDSRIWGNISVIIFHF